MRAVRITTLDGPSAVEVVDIDAPEPGHDQVLIAVHAAGVTFPEVLQSRGRYQLKPSLPFVPGSEVAGVVLSAPEGSAVTTGDRVAAFPMLGGFAERVVAPTELVFGIGAQLPFDKAAAIPMNYLTMEFALAHRGRLGEGDTVLVHGASGGIGTAAIQMSKALGANQVIACCSTQAKGAVARTAGADDVVMVDGFKDRVLELTDGRGVDVVVDPVGGDRFTDSLRSLASDGRLLVIGFTAGEIPTVKVNRLLLNNIDVVGVGWGAYALAHPGHIAGQWERIAPHIHSGAIDPVIGGTYVLERAAEALADLEERRAAGKVILTVS